MTVSALTADPAHDVQIATGHASPLLRNWLGVEHRSRAGLAQGSTGHGTYRASRHTWDEIITDFVGYTTDHRMSAPMQGVVLDAAELLVQLLGHHDPEGYAW